MNHVHNTHHDHDPHDDTDQFGTPPLDEGDGGRGRRRGGPRRVGGPRDAGPWGRGGRPRGGHGRGRRRRGAVRAAILTQLATGPSNGYGLIRSISERTQGAWTPSPGSIYPTLQQLVDEGLIEPTSPGPGPDYQLTAEGLSLVTDQAEELDLVWHGAAAGGAPGLAELDGSVEALMGAIAQVHRIGTPEQVSAARAEVDRTRRTVYRILSEDADTAAGMPQTGMEDQA